jgi:hypothetical protein
MDEMGWKQPLDVIFRDEELIPETVINHVLRLRDEPDRWNLHYFAMPMKSHYFIMGKHLPYVQWDEKRRGNWVREKPPGCIEQIHPENKPLDQHEVNPLMNLALGWKGSICLFNGVRTQESLQRFMSCIAVKNQMANYVSKDSGGAKGTDFNKVIFDWSEKDVFRYFYDRNIRYCHVYDVYMHAGAPLRVATPLHDKAFQQLQKLRITYPVFYGQILSIWPEVAAQERYWADYDPMRQIDDFPKSFGGILQFIDERMDDPQLQAKAREAVINCRRFKEKNKREGKFPEACHGYPILYVFQQIVKGNFLRGITSNKTPKEPWNEYERLAQEEEATRARGG